MKKDEKNKDQDLKDFQDLSGVSLKEMNFGLWLSENRKKITKIFIIFLITISAFFFIYSSYNYIIYFLTGKTEVQTENLISSPRNLVQEIVFGETMVYSENNSFDLAISLKNNNDNFEADFKYCFEQLGKEINCGSSFILPKSEKYILALNQKLENGTDAVSLKISDIFWSRINKRTIPDWSEFYFNHLNFLVENIEFSGNSSSGLSEEVGLSSLEFNISNLTSYSYYEVPLNILLFSNNGLVGVHRYLLDNFISGENRKIRLSWPADLEAVSRVEIVSDLNMLNPDVFKKYEGEVKN